MESTRIQSSPSQDTLPVPAAPSVPAEAHRRAPTLMAGSAGGGEVVVWAPDKLVLAAQGTLGLVSFVPGWAAFFYAWYVMEVDRPPYLLLPMLLLVLALVGIRYGTVRIPAILRRPYITSDERGIGVTTDAGSRFLAWDDLGELSYEAGSYRLTLENRAGELIVVRLLGYRPDDRAKLYDHIRKRAFLNASRPLGTRQNSFRDPGAPGAGPVEQALAPGSRAVPALPDPLAVLRGLQRPRKGHPLPKGINAWHPSPGRLYGLAAAWAGGGIGASLLWSAFVPRYHSAMSPVFYFCLMRCFDLFGRGRDAPARCITSAAGIRTFGLRGRAISWEEIQSMKVGRWRLTLMTGERIRISLMGCSSKTRRELPALIAEKAALAPDPQKPRQYLPRSVVQPLLPLAEARDAQVEDDT